MIKIEAFSFQSHTHQLFFLFLNTCKCMGVCAWTHTHTNTLCVCVCVCISFCELIFITLDWQGVLKHSLLSDESVSKLLDRKWALSSPDARINQIMILNRNGGQLNLNGDISFQNFAQPCLGEGMMKKNHFPSFYVVRDDLLHPLVNGNKARKLDALLPLLEDNDVTDVVRLCSPELFSGGFYLKWIWSNWGPDDKDHYKVGCSRTISVWSTYSCKYYDL